MQTWSGWRYKSENKARRCVVTVVIVIVVNAATSKMNHQMQPDLSTINYGDNDNLNGRGWWWLEFVVGVGLLAS